MSKRHIAIYGLVAVVVILIAGIGIFAIQHSSVTPEKLLSLGEKYLTELNYEQALVQFLKIIEIDPMNPRGYTGAAEAYVGLGRMEDARNILEQGLMLLSDNADIAAMLGELTPMLQHASENSDTFLSEEADSSALILPDPMTEDEINFYNSLTDEQKGVLETLKESLISYDYDTTRNVLLSDFCTNLFKLAPGNSDAKQANLPNDLRITYDGYGRYSARLRPMDSDTGTYIYAHIYIWSVEPNDYIGFSFRSIEYKNGIANGELLLIKEEFDTVETGTMLQTSFHKEVGQALNGFIHGEIIETHTQYFRGDVHTDKTTSVIYNEGKIVPYHIDETDGRIYIEKIIEDRVHTNSTQEYIGTTQTEILDQVEFFEELKEIK